MIKNLILSGDEFIQLNRGFMGGHTHANAYHVDKVMTDVIGYDFKSSYPSVMVMEKFPMSSPYHIDDQINKEDFETLLKTRCCIFDVELTGLVPKLHFEHPISKSKCFRSKGLLSDKNMLRPLDNGRVITAESVTLTVTELDWDTISKFYSWDEMKIYNFTYFDKAYLPKNFVMAILKLFKDKTTLDGVEGQEVNYMIAKNMLNALYGMIVTNPCRDEYVYDHIKTIKRIPDIDNAIEKYNNDIKRFLYYPWGVWVTAYARHNLFSGILECKNDYVYSDTDSIYLINGDSHKDYFENYNLAIQDKIQAAADYHKISVDEFSPVNPTGEKKTLGIWDFQGHYEKFKTLGAKRYLYQKDGKCVLTLSGANKKKALDYLLTFNDPFEAFSNQLVIPEEYSGRLTMTYIDEESSGYAKDYLGNTFEFHELSSVHADKTQYKMSIANDYIAYLMEVREMAPM